MECKNIEEFEEKLRKAINSQDIEKFRNIINYCPFSLVGCLDCQLSEKEGPKELMGSLDTCLLGSTRDVYWDYKRHKINEETALAGRVVMSIELLAYLESKE